MPESKTDEKVYTGGKVCNGIAYRAGSTKPAPPTPQVPAFDDFGGNNLLVAISNTCTSSVRHFVNSSQ